MQLFLLQEQALGVVETHVVITHLTARRQMFDLGVHDLPRMRRERQRVPEHCVSACNGSACTGGDVTGGRCGGAAAADGVVVEADAADRSRPSVVAALPVCSSVVKVVIPPTESACRGERAINVQRRRQEVNRASRAAASGALLVVAVVAAAARAAATLEAGGQLGIAIGGAASRCS
eukprot:scaffold25545_cov44-Phaeocystis_antarctica.AAC.1